jgi:MSHA biogenesis protein MshJ
MKRLHLLLARIDRASLRERILLFSAAALGLTMLWYQLAMTPLERRRARLDLQLSQLRTPGAAGIAPGADVASEFADRMARETALHSAIAEADHDLLDARRGMIAPNDMVQVLTTVLKQHNGLSLVLIRNMPAEPLLPPLAQAATTITQAAAGAGPSDPHASAGAPGDAPDLGGGPYVHPIELVLQGDYLDVLAYLKALEAQSSGFQWRRFEYAGRGEAPEYRIEFATVSMDSNWLGV